MTDDELTYATAGAHSLFVGIPEMNAFPDACVDDFIDSLGEPEPEMIEGRMSRAVRDHRHSGFVTEERYENLGHSAADLVMGRRIFRVRWCRQEGEPIRIGRDSEGVRASDSTDRAPEVVRVL